MGTMVSLEKLAMIQPTPTFPTLRSIRNLLGVATVFGVLVLPALAVTTKSLLPEFGTKGREIQPKAKQGYDIRGWLPKDWVDNSSWAPVSATYSQLTDAPAEGVGAVRIEVTKLDGFHLQLTTKSGAMDYKAGTTYVVTGWMRSPQQTGFFVGFRADAEPRDFHAGKDFAPGTDWEKFSFEWTPENNSSAWLMFTVHNVGVVDLAGIALTEKQ